MTDQQEILNKLATEVRLSLRPKSIAIWTFIFNYIEEHGYADAVDENFLSEMESRFNLSARASGVHLRRMARAGLLKRWEGTIEPGQTSPWTTLFTGIQPTRIMRYTLPGQKPPREMYRQEREN